MSLKRHLLFPAAADYAVGVTADFLRGHDGLSAEEFLRAVFADTARVQAFRASGQLNAEAVLSALRRVTKWQDIPFYAYATWQGDLNFALAEDRAFAVAKAGYVQAIAHVFTGGGVGGTNVARGMGIDASDYGPMAEQSPLALAGRMVDHAVAQGQVPALTLLASQQVPGHREQIQAAANALLAYFAANP